MDSLSRSLFVEAMDRIQAMASQKNEITLLELFELLGSKSHSLLILFLCLPYLQPLPIPGLSTPFGFLIGLISIFMYLRRPPWLPKRFYNLKLSMSILLKISEVAEKIWIKAGRFLRQRWPYFVISAPFRQINLAVVLVNSVLLALPLPIPFSNMFPIIPILLCTLANIEKDGLLILLSYIFCLVCFGFFVVLLSAAW